MKKIVSSLLVSFAFLVVSCQQNTSDSKNKHLSSELKPKTIFFDQKVEDAISDLLSKMTVEEKVGQMTQVTLDYISKGAPYDANKKQELDDSLLLKTLVKYKVGSILNTGQYTLPREQWNNFIARIQQETQKTPLKIPVLYGVDAIHGANYTVGATLFPQELATAATFDTRYAEACGMVTAYELRASSIPWNFSPVLDLGRQPLWSRFFETFGEDPYVVTQMGNALVKGYQGSIKDGKIDQDHVAACLKHFLGYSNSKTGKDRTPIQMSERELREYYLVPFKEAISQGAQSVMINSTEINGLPVHANHHILTDILKEELSFDGFAVTDWEDIIFLHTTHKIAKDYKEAVKLAINAGVDMSMVPLDLTFADHLVDLVKEGEVKEERINDAVRRILRVKYRVGLFDNQEQKEYPDFGSDKFSMLALQAARESVTLLKNQNSILPLDKTSKVLFTGVGANSLNALNGAWTHTWQGVNEKYNTKGKETIFQAANRLVGAHATHATGSSYDELKDLSLALEKAKSSDAIEVCLGEMPATEKVGDVVDLNLPAAQKELVRAMKKTGKPVIVVLLQSRPRIISDIEPLMDAVLACYWPGDEGGLAIAETLYGLNNPSGKLPFTFPRYTNDLLTYDHKFSEKKDKDFGLNGFNPQWEFGEGYSYTTFEYSNLTVSDTLLGDQIEVTVQIQNTGELKGKETVILYSRDHFASITPSVKRVRKFTKIELAPGEQKEVKFDLAIEDLSFLNNDLKWVTEPGKFDLMVADLTQEVAVK